MFSLTISVRKVLMILSNPTARLCLKLTYNSLIYELPTTYKVLKETQIPDPFNISLSDVDGTLKFEAFLIFLTKNSNVNEKLIGTYSINLNEVLEKDGKLIKSQWELNDETTEKIYQPKVSLLFMVEKKDDDGVSPTFNKNAAIFSTEDPFRLKNLSGPQPTPTPSSQSKISNDQNITESIEKSAKEEGNEELKVSIHNHLEKNKENSQSPYRQKYKPTFRQNNNLKRSVTPNPIVGTEQKSDFLRSLAVGYVALLRKRNKSQTPQKRGGGDDDYEEDEESNIDYNEENGNKNEENGQKNEYFKEEYEIIQNSENPMQKKEKAKKKANRQNNNSKNDHLSSPEEKETFFKIELYENENLKLQLENVGLGEALKNENSEIFNETNNKTEGFSEIKLLQTANQTIVDQILNKDNEIKNLKQKIAETYAKISAEQRKIDDCNGILSEFRKEFKKLKETPDYMRLLSKYQNLERKSIENESFGFCSELDAEIAKERELHERLQEIYQANIEENERSGDDLAQEMEVLKEKMKELGDVRDKMKKMLLAKDERVGELEKKEKVMNMLIVKGKETKARIVNSMFENRNAEIIELMDQNQKKMESV